MDPQEFEALGLNPDRIASHLGRIRKTLKQGTSPQFSIVDTCRLDNHGILPLSKFTGKSAMKEFAAFVPAAGAATRYSAALGPIRAALVGGGRDAVVHAASTIHIEGPLPRLVRELLENPQDFPVDRYDDVVMQLDLPKALQPCVEDTLDTFLTVKDLEHRALGGLKAQVYVAPHDMADMFLTHLGSSPLATSVIEQGRDLSTVRVDESGEIVLDGGKPSIVPAGHGALTEKLPEVRQKFANCDAVFIRNIDNVMGTNETAKEATEQFLAAYSFVFDHIQTIRGALRDDSLDSAESAAAALLTGTEETVDADTSPLDQVLAKLFYTRSTSPSSLDTWRAHYHRPFNILGQVPNTANDVGGTPCFVRRADETIKLCLEVPHASEEDKQSFLANASKATHFNPVFACAEITDDPEYYANLADDFWLLAKKQFKGKSVYYHESVLYELIGNSVMANCLFVEVPRAVFHPHKTIADGAGRTFEGWFRSKTPKS